jgi:hypothetical protein
LGKCWDAFAATAAYTVAMDNHSMVGVGFAGPGPALASAADDVDLGPTTKTGWR